jgi:hypothetical protein
MQYAYHPGKVRKPGSTYRIRIGSPVGRRRNNHCKLVIVAVVCIVLFQLCYSPRFSITGGFKSFRDRVACPNSPIADDVLVVVRTGMTEALEKLPVHFDTTLKCVPNHAIFSDHEENIQGHQVHDVLNKVSETLKASVPEFELYEHLKREGREDLNNSKHLGSGPNGSPENTAWKLDRFKFLPMVERAQRHQPGAKWFVFVEADTYMMWPNLLEYLSKFDAAQDLYIGKQMFIGDVLFAHGGSGFILSSSAARKVTNHWKAHIIAYDKYTAESWAGDMVLGKVLKDVDISLTWAFPHFQGDPIHVLDHNISKIDRRPWCYAPITYHHMQEEGIRDLWEFEQARERRKSQTTLHRDVFREFIVPKLAARIDDWDNLSIDAELKDAASFDECRELCEAQRNCLQFSYSARKCATSAEVRYGNAARTRCIEYSTAASKCIRRNEEQEKDSSIQSGWMLDRLPQYMEEMDTLCAGDGSDAWAV